MSDIYDDITQLREQYTRRHQLVTDIDWWMPLLLAAAAVLAAAVGAMIGGL